MEALQLATVERLERALAIYLVIVWRILYLMTLGRDCPDLPSEVAFTAEEWRAAWLMAKRQPPPTLGEMIRLVAGFGGFLGRQDDGRPGPGALIRGPDETHGLCRGVAHGSRGLRLHQHLWVMGRIVDTACILGIATNTVISTLKNFKEVLTVNPYIGSRHLAVEIRQLIDPSIKTQADEQWSFVQNKKNQRRLW